MNSRFLFLIVFCLPGYLLAQDLSEGLIINDLASHPMQDIAKPAYLDTIIDPSFGTTIRRISNAGEGGVIVPMYSTIQAWNADESLMILYNQSQSHHELLNGMTYELIRILDDIAPDDIEQIFWDFDDPDIFYYPDHSTKDFIKYSISAQSKEIIVNMTETSSCAGGISMGNDIQMMSWDSDVFTFRCNNETAFSYRISTGETTTFDIVEINYTATSIAPSGKRYYHRSQVYDSSGILSIELNINSTEHSCIGKLPNGNDAYFAIAFAEGPQGGCIGDIIAHDLNSGECFPVISQSEGYNYPQSGTHISALAHKNTEGGWMAASMMGYEKNGQVLLDQELVIAKAEKGNIKVCRIGHHRSDEDQFDYWGEPHAVISPSGTRVLFASDWSGDEDGESVDSYVVELPIFSTSVVSNNLNPEQKEYKIFPNPVNDHMIIEMDNSTTKDRTIHIYNSNGKIVKQENILIGQFKFNLERLNSGLYFFTIADDKAINFTGKFIKT